MDIAFTHADVITGRDGRTLRDATVVVRGTRLVSVDPAPPPDGIPAIDVAGKTVMPGLIDLHVHLHAGTTDLYPDRGFEGPLAVLAIKAFARAHRTLLAGYTTIRDAGDIGDIGVSVRDAVKGGFVEGPRVVACGLYISATSGHGNPFPHWLSRNDIQSAVADGPDELVKLVRSQIHSGTDWIKFCATGGGSLNTWDQQQFSDLEIEAIVGEAHAKGRPVAAHCIQTKGTLAAVKAGVDSVEHGVYLTEEICDLMVTQGTWLVPTLFAPTAIIRNGVQFGLPPERVEACRPSFEAHRKSIQMALARGVKIACGTDAGLGPVVHGKNAYELELLVEAGMTPMQTITAATLSSAQALRLADQLGTLEPGKQADLLVIDGDPLGDIKILQDPSRLLMVMKGGKPVSGPLSAGVIEPAFAQLKRWTV